MLNRTWTAVLAAVLDIIFSFYERETLESSRVQRDCSHQDIFISLIYVIIYPAAEKKVDSGKKYC